MMTRNQKRKARFERDARFQDEDLYSKNSRRVRKFASQLVFVGMLLMFPELFIVCGWFTAVPWRSLWTLLFLTGALMNMSAYACLAYGRQFRYIKDFLRLNKVIGIGGNADDGRKAE
jgi:phosphoglycerol transferase MdoB-like AlkP superfamily enzyme